MSDEENEATMRKVVDRLLARFPDAPKPRVAEIVREEFASLASGRIRIYIPTLVENAARDRLHQEFNIVAILD
ncbi:three-helix bundle dimerization domain-containing protein [Arthrobacter sp. C9C5]|uniref:three-helix bundle dimerization domain-containing protein n=1 Tax=Arthrobacter sp. C9C5 TaxID=2735267 RepID=UPI001584D87C|nr:hypothetical protein [Arthrobacter sp. C9C5]NUU31892.1 hypothetical protein [Arthrobacter sp. C9C5]